MRTATMQPTPPMTTENGAPATDATRPASSSPSCGPPMKKIMFTLVMRPRSLSGVMSWRIVWRMTVLTVSAEPETASIRSESQYVCDRPKTTVAAPYTATESRTVRPGLPQPGLRVRKSPVKTAPNADEAAADRVREVAFGDERRHQCLTRRVVERDGGGRERRQRVDRPHAAEARRRDRRQSGGAREHHALRDDDEALAVNRVGHDAAQ